MGSKTEGLSRGSTESGGGVGGSVGCRLEKLRESSRVGAIAIGGEAARGGVSSGEAARGRGFRRSGESDALSEEGANSGGRRSGGWRMGQTLGWVRGGPET